MAENSITRLSELPPSDNLPQNITYTPLNAHPNPYVSNDQPVVQQPEYKLPPRHVSFDTNQYNDERVQANYIPRGKNDGYVEEYEERYIDEDKNMASSKYRRSKLEKLISELHMPILISVLYFIFNMPIFNSFLNNNFSFLHIYDSEGNFSFYGIIFKSILFGGFYYLWTNFIEYFNE